MERRDILFCLADGIKMNEENFPNRKYLFDNLLKVNTGAYRCMIQGLQPEDANCRTYDYPVCNNQEGCGKCSVIKNNSLEVKAAN